MADQLQSQPISFALAADNVVVAANANGVHHIHFLELTNTSTATVTFTVLHGSTPFHGPYALAPGDWWTFSTDTGEIKAAGGSDKERTWRGAKNEAIKLRLDVAKQVSGFVQYATESI